MHSLPSCLVIYAVVRDGAIARKLWIKMVLQGDGAPAHRLRAVAQRWQQLLTNRVVSQGPPLLTHLIFSCVVI